ncbi:type II toxin-antitoxin system PemK/MazF family toxin [Prosthecodimorpha staleyi]|uniref:Type II toxin-antitoxin system PemK/MazF family toxin n=1 Tax=Prosthecodimorpha staleyi TaxID=2840188 RepID=A0A947GEW5_9HYPH|nr:type II toxin-antitoxin system PemK/MazF family toxin [Prosthecodimorpha staleyi]MBT9291996.1 type II toxin-antitoxin system PemK/MazF family toxin [Prosthecodimorpha staleyi]
MPIRYPVGPGTILLCDYSLGGFREPELVKRRPAVVVSPRLPFRDELCTVVPLSGTEPARSLPYVVRVAFETELPAPFSQTVWWAKCDMIATVGFGRPDLFRTDRDQTGRRKYLHPKLLEFDLVRVRQGILNALGMGP